MFYFILSLIQVCAFSAVPGLGTWESIKNTKYTNTIEQDDIALYVPTKLAHTVPNRKEMDSRMDAPPRYEETNPNNHVGRRIMDHTFRNFVKGKLTPNAAIFRTVEKVEQSMNYDISIPKTNEYDIEHKFRLQYQPFQSIAKVRYSGFMNANMEYNFRDSFMEYSVEKTINNDTLLTVVQGQDPYAETQSALTMLNLRVSWY